MKDEIELVVKDLWDNHRYSTLGVLIGIVLSILVLLFGFWKIVFIAVCACVGLFIGKKLDNGEDVLAKIWEFLKEQWRKG